MPQHTSSSGYAVLQNSPLGRPHYHENILMRAWERDFLPMIVNTAIAEPLTHCFQQIQFMREPNVGAWRKYEYNQSLIPDTVSPDATTMRICNAAYKAIKFDQNDVDMICNRFDAFEDAFLNSAWQTLMAMWRCYVMDAMVLEADACNKGINAGLAGNINLGATGSPRVINGDTFVGELAKLQRVLVERNRWVDGEMFIIIPPAVAQMLYQTPYASALELGSCAEPNMLCTGQVPGMIMGFHVFVTNDVVSQIDGGSPAYYIIAGHNSAFAFAGDIIQSRIVEPSHSFSLQYQMAAIWGGEAIYSDALTVGYWRV